MYDMNYQEVFHSARLLSREEQLQLIVSLSQRIREDASTSLRSRSASLINKQGNCPHCEGSHYYRYGTARGAQRFKCKSCGRTFCEYTGTWLEGIHKKSLIEPYLELMLHRDSLDKTSKKLGINKKTAFDWRHKILSSIEQDTGEQFAGIVESDETFFEHSEKGKQGLQRPARKRGTDKKNRGISTNKAAVIVSTDRKRSMKMTVSTMGRITKVDIKESFQNPLSETTTLCSDGHVSYKGYSMDHHLNHVVLRSDLKQYVKKGIYHIQHVNEIHNRLKKWLDGTFWGVSTKYLQNYLNWFYLQERLKSETITVEKVVLESLQNTHAIKQYRYNDLSYDLLLAIQNKTIAK
jgi:transposase-like protein